MFNGHVNSIPQSAMVYRVVRKNRPSGGQWAVPLNTETVDMEGAIACQTVGYHLAVHKHVADLLVEGHPADEVVHAMLQRQGRVLERVALVGRCGGSRSKGGGREGRPAGSCQGQRSYAQCDSGGNAHHRRRSATPRHGKLGGERCGEGR